MHTLLSLPYDAADRICRGQLFTISEKVDGMLLSAKVDSCGNLWLKTSKSDWTREYKKWYEQKFESKAPLLVQQIDKVFSALIRDYAFNGAMRRRVLDNSTLVDSPFHFEVLSSFLAKEDDEKEGHYKQVRTTYQFKSVSRDFIVLVAHSYCQSFFSFANAFVDTTRGPVEIIFFPPNECLIAMRDEDFQIIQAELRKPAEKVTEARANIQSARLLFKEWLELMMNNSSMSTIFRCDQPEGIVVSEHGVYNPIRFKQINSMWLDLPLSKHLMKED